MSACLHLYVDFGICGNCGELIMPLVFGVTRIVSYVKETAADDKASMLVFEFMTAYKELRRACPRGDLRIHLSVQGSPEEVGAVFEDVVK